ncbi:hypothetical protein RYX36_022735, partial [Vicia faba]
GHFIVVTKPNQKIQKVQFELTLTATTTTNQRTDFSLERNPRLRSEKTMEYLGIDLSCALGSLRKGNFPDKDCLLPLISKLLGYAIVAASTTVKLPQALLLCILFSQFIVNVFSHIN